MVRAHWGATTAQTGRARAGCSIDPGRYRERLVEGSSLGCRLDRGATWLRASSALAGVRRRSTPSSTLHSRLSRWSQGETRFWTRLELPPFAGAESGKARIPRDAVQREGRLETYRHLNSHGFELIHRALHPPAGKLIEFVIDLRPERFESLIERLGHPVMQARAAYHMVTATRALDHPHAVAMDYRGFMRCTGCAGNRAYARNGQAIGRGHSIRRSRWRGPTHLEHRASSSTGRP